MRKSDLKPGMVVEYANGRKRLVININNELCLIGVDMFTELYKFNEDLTNRDSGLNIVKIFQPEKALGLKDLLKCSNCIWERKLTRSKIKAGFTMTNENGVNYLIVNSNCDLRIMNTEHFVIGPKLCDIINENMSPTNSDYATIVEVKDKEGKVVYKKK